MLCYCSHARRVRKNSYTDNIRLYTSQKKNQTKVTLKWCLSSSLQEYAQPVSRSKLQTADATVQKPLTQTECQTYILPEFIITSLCNPRITSSFTEVQNVFQILNTTYSGLSFGIMELKGSFKRLKKKQHRSLETNIGFRGYCGWLKTVRSKLRFHNCSVLTGDLDGHRPVQGQLGVQLTEEDIFQSHPIGKSNRNGNIQIICRFRYRRWRTMFFKKQLKTHLYSWEDLTRCRQSLIQELTKAKSGGSIHLFWTNDGCIFARFKDKLDLKIWSAPSMTSRVQNLLIFTKNTPLSSHYKLADI